MFLLEKISINKKWGLVGLTLVFSFRIFAQLTQYFWNISWLPAFETWHSSTIPYTTLVVSQFLILGLQIWIAIKYFRGWGSYSATRGRVFVYLGLIYFLVMLFRLISGQSFLSHVSWMASWIPAFFHMVLALFIVLTGLIHLEKSKTQILQESI